MVPLTAPPMTAQVTVGSLALSTTAMNCCVRLMFTLAVLGDTVTATGFVMVTRALPYLVLSALLVARTSTIAGAGSAGGAV